MKVNSYTIIARKNNTVFEKIFTISNADNNSILEILFYDKNKNFVRSFTVDNGRLTKIDIKKWRLNQFIENSNVSLNYIVRHTKTNNYSIDILQGEWKVIQ